MNDLVSSINGVMMANSIHVGRVFSKDHRKVLRDIEKLDCSDKFRTANFGQSEFTSLQNKKLKCIDMTKDGFVFLCMGWRGKKAAEWKEKYINAFNEMESGLLNIDSRINKLSIQGNEISKAGKDWSAFGLEVKRRKNKYLELKGELLDDIQGKLEF